MGHSCQTASSVTFRKAFRYNYTVRETQAAAYLNAALIVKILLRVLKEAQIQMAKASQRSNTPPANPVPTSIPVPIASSHPLGWKPLLVEEFRQPPGGIDVPEVWDSHSIALCLAPRPHRIVQRIGDRRYSGLYSKGDISITPADVPASYQAAGEDHYLHVQLPKQVLQTVAQDALDIDARHLELVTQFRVRDPQLEQTLLLLRSELHQGGAIGQLYVESLANVLAIHLLRHHSSRRPCGVNLMGGGLGDRKLLQVSEYIRAHLDQAVTLADLANSVSLSPFHFSRLFKQSLGISPHQYLLQQRIARAQDLLKQSNLAIAEIALQCGFNSQSHLGKQFRASTGMTPSEYRRA